MLTISRTPLLRHGRHAALALLLTLVGGLSAPFVPSAHAATTAVGSVELSPTPPNETQAVPPNIVVTFDDSGSMGNDYMGDTRPFDNGSWSGPWKCAGVIDPTAASGLGALTMNGVYFNPKVTYTPPVNANGSSFPQADATLAAVQNDGVTANRPLNPSGSGSTKSFIGTKTTGPATGWYWPGTGSSTDYSTWVYGTLPATGTGWYALRSSRPTKSSQTTYGTYPTTTTDSRWTCTADSTSPLGDSGGPYYYKYTGPALVDDGFGKPDTASIANLYTSSNWTAVAVSSTDYQNWANWWAYYHNRNLMARTSLSRVFGDSNLAAKNSSGGFGSTIRVAWQNLNVSTYKLPSDAIISALVDTASCSNLTADPSTTQRQGAVTTAPACYRSAFFNWIFQVPANNSTPSRGAVYRAGTFFQRGSGNTGGTGNLEDPYWQPPATGTGDGDELSCRQNFHMLITDGLWNQEPYGSTLPTVSSLAQPTSGLTLPDGTTFGASDNANVTAIYAAQNDASGAVSLSDLAFHYWATDLRPDLYDPANGKYVAPYLPDSSTGVTTTAMTSLNGVNSANVNKEIYFNPKNDPANWPHMAEYMIGLGVSGQLHYSDNTDCTDSSNAGADACNLRKGAVNSTGSVGWPTPNGSGSGIAANIDDTWHAALAGRGQFFSAANPQNLVDQLSNVLTNIQARTAQPTTGAVNASVLTTGALAFNTGYSSIDWTGVLKAYQLNADGTTSSFVWDAASKLDSATPASRQILTGSMDSSTGKVTGMAFESSSAFDTAELAGLSAPAATDTTNDTLANRVDYLRGVRTQETSSVMRKRNTLLGAIINSQAVYVSYPSSGYTSSWPSGSPEAAATAETYDDFVSNNANRAGTLYVGANDGMLHAFDASLVNNGDGTYGPGQAATAGEERWAYVPRAVYGNLGNLTSKSSFSFQPTVDGTPVVRDVFFSSDSKWHTILVGGLRLGGRGVYALDITDPTAVKESSASSKVLWEFDADAPAVTGVGNPADLGYTYGQPNIGRLANGKWVVLVPTGYYPDCSQADKPANCATLAAASNGYSALFVLDAQTGAMIAELKTPTNITGVSSYGLTSPVLGDYNNDQIDDVAFAGDLAGNLWRFDLSDANSANWSVTLAYKGIADSSGNQGVQPITVMPRLFPDPATNRFMVVFGTGKYLGAGDNTSTSAAVQSVYGIRDELDSSDKPVTITHDTLQQQTLTETTVTDSSDPNYGATVRKLTSNTVSSSAGGWYFDLDITAAAGERVVVTPGAIFSSNTAIISTVIPGSSDPCNPTVEGAAMFVDATTGSPGTGVSSLGGSPVVGARVNNVRTSGTIPVTTTVGGGKSILPGMTLTGKKNNTDTPITGDAPIWRRRGWSELNNGQ